MTREQVRAYLTTLHSLRDSESHKGIFYHVQRSGCIQFDPLDQVGNNHDQVLQSRVSGYKKGDINNLLYGHERKLIDLWDKNMSVVAIEDWPYFSRIRASHPQWHNSASEEEMKIILSYLDNHECACSSDIEIPNSRKALEYMTFRGILSVHHKNGTRRFYAPSSRLIPSSIFNQEDPNPTEESFWSWYVLRRIKSVGCLFSGPSDAYLGLYCPPPLRQKVFSDLVAQGAIIEIQVEDLKRPIFIPSENLTLLNNAAPCSSTEPVRFLAPLDNLLWDRKIIKALFDYHYSWEVYVPQDKRVYGYYVIPVLWGDNLVGRIEFDCNKKDKTLSVKRFWPEQNLVPNSQWEQAFSIGLNRYTSYLGCELISNVKG